MDTMKRPRIGAETFSAPFTLAASDKATMTFKGMALAFGSPVDCYPPTIFVKGAFAKTLQENGPRLKILWQHDTWEPIGIPTLTETDQGLEIVGRLDAIPTGERAMAQIQSGTLTDLSIGFDPIKWQMIDPSGSGGFAAGLAKYGISGVSPQTIERFQAAGEPVRIMQEARLWEVSIVTFGAQPVARIKMSANPYRDLPVAAVDNWDASAALARVREWARVDQEKLSRAFLAGGQTPRFQIADVIDGKLQAVPGAVFAAALAVASDKEIPEHVLGYLREGLSAYYQKMGRVAPWDAGRLSILEGVASLPADVFAGKVLSSANKALLEQALTALQSLLASAVDAVDKIEDGLDDAVDEGVEPPDADPATVAATIQSAQGADVTLEDIAIREMEVMAALVGLSIA